MRSPITLALAAVLAAILPGGAHAQSMLHTPGPGSPERAAILDGLRAGGGEGARTFVVREIRVAGDWAWVEADPRSGDGRLGDEPESALLRREGGAWKVVDRPCGEAGCSVPRELARIRAAHPRVPIGVVPLAR